MCGKCIQYRMNYSLELGLCEVLWIRKFLFCCTWLARLQEFPDSLHQSLYPSFHSSCSLFCSVSKGQQGIFLSGFSSISYWIPETWWVSCHSITVCRAGNRMCHVSAGLQGRSDEQETAPNLRVLAVGDETGAVWPGQGGGELEDCGRPGQCS